MNRSILIVICDFLLVSLLAFSTVDINKVADEGTPRIVKTDIATNQIDTGKDLAAVMRLALEEERKSHDVLLGELTKTRDTAEKQRTLLTEREREALRLQREQTNLQQQFATAQTNIQTLSRELQVSSSEALISKEKLAAMQAELRKQAEQAAALQQQLTLLTKSNQAALTEKQQLASRLQVAEVERRSAAEQAVRMQEQVKVEREEKAKLAEGVKALASKSSQLADEIRENRPLAPNTIFSSFVTNRVQARFNAFRPTLLGIDSNRRKETETVLVTDGTNTFALCHVQDTPLTLWDPGTEWEGLTGTLDRNGASFPIRSLSFCQQDPRVVLVPVTAKESRDLGCHVYRISSEPFKFQDAVLIGAREGYYGECRFQIDLTTPDYVKLDHNFLKGLFGKFNPTRGDLVFSRTGALLGVMVNSSYCLMIRNFNAAPTVQFGKDIRAQHTGPMLSRLYSFIFQLPFKLQ
jgi:hypothetical protein